MIAIAALLGAIIGTALVLGVYEYRHRRSRAASNVAAWDRLCEDLKDQYPDQY